jgi:hypothetical protein
MSTDAVLICFDGTGETLVSHVYVRQKMIVLYLIMNVTVLNQEPCGKHQCVT